MQKIVESVDKISFPSFSIKVIEMIKRSNKAPIAADNSI